MEPTTYYNFKAFTIYLEQMLFLYVSIWNFFLSLQAKLLLTADNK